MSKEVEFVDPEATLASADGGTNDLRLFELKVNRKLSWSAWLRDLAWEVIYNRDLRGLARSAHKVVSFNAAGGVPPLAP